MSEKPKNTDLSVAYDNSLNKVDLHAMTGKEMDVFFLLVAKSQERGTDTIHIQANEINSMLHVSAEKQREVLANVLRKTAAATAVMRAPDGGICGGSLFPYFYIPPRGPASADVSVNEKLLYVVNDLQHYTRYELTEFASLRTARAKTLYRLCKQFRRTGMLAMTIQDVRTLFGVPESYTPKKIMQKVIIPMTEEVSRYITGLACVSVTGSGQGKPTTGYRWTFQAEGKEVAVEGPEENKGTTVINGTAYEYEQEHLNTEKKKAAKPRKTKNNNFDNFEQHEYSKTEMAAIEKRLLDK